MRPGEQEGDVYHFATEEEFSQAIIEGKFLEWVSIDNGRRYGTLKADILDALRAGKCVVREVEPIGARHIKEMLGDEVVSIFITPGTWEDVEARMRARAPMDAAELGERKKRYAEELSFGAEAQYIVPNPYGKLEEAKEQFASTIRTIIAKNTNP